MLQNSKGVFVLRSAKRRKHADWAEQAHKNMGTVINIRRVEKLA